MQMVLQLTMGNIHILIMRLQSFSRALEKIWLATSISSLQESVILKITKAKHQHPNWVIIFSDHRKRHLHHLFQQQDPLRLPIFEKITTQERTKKALLRSLSVPITFIMLYRYIINLLICLCNCLSVIVSVYVCLVEKWCNFECYVLVYFI